MEKKQTKRTANAKGEAKAQQKRQGGLLAQLLILALLLLVGAHLLTLQKKLDTAKSELEALSTQVEAQQQENDALSSALEKADDEEYLQQLAREKLDMVTPGERVFYDVSN